MRAGLHLRSTRLRRLCSALYSECFTLCLPWVTGWRNSNALYRQRRLRSISLDWIISLNFLLVINLAEVLRLLRNLPFPYVCGARLKWYYSLGSILDRIEKSEKRKQFGIKRWNSKGISYAVPKNDPFLKVVFLWTNEFLTVERKHSAVSFKAAVASDFSNNMQQQLF